MHFARAMLPSPVMLARPKRDARSPRNPTCVLVGQILPNKNSNLPVTVVGQIIRNMSPCAKFLSGGYDNVSAPASFRCVTLLRATAALPT